MVKVGILVLPLHVALSMGSVSFLVNYANLHSKKVPGVFLMMLTNLSGMPNAFICQSVSSSMQGVK